VAALSYLSHKVASSSLELTQAANNLTLASNAFSLVSSVPVFLTFPSSVSLLVLKAFNSSSVNLMDTGFLLATVLHVSPHFVIAVFSAATAASHSVFAVFMFAIFSLSLILLLTVVWALTASSFSFLAVASAAYAAVHFLYSSLFLSASLAVS